MCFTGPLAALIIKNSHLPWEKMRKSAPLFLFCALLYVMAFSLQAVADDKVADAKTEARADTSADKKNYYVETGGYATQRETDPPRYVHPLSKSGYEQFKDIDWLDAGLQSRTRGEYRNNNFRRSVSSLDAPILQRTRGYLAVHDIFDPLRATLEVQDSRKFHSDFPADNRDVNYLDFIQAYGELYFKDGLADRAVSIRAGRMAYDELDRRLISRNEWRNTTNSFQGVRAIIGENKDDWQLDTMFLQPVDRLVDAGDVPNKRQLFYGGIFTWRRWSDIATIQPFYLGLHQDGIAALPDRVIHSPGLRAFGFVGKTGFDYDSQFVYQFGRSGNLTHRAMGTVIEVGYRFKDDWKTRLSTNYGYGSGDSSPADHTDNRFERFYGFARPWSNNDYFQWENLHAPKMRVEIQPDKKLKMDAGYSAYWLASDSDRWNNANLRDPSGRSGNFIGQEFDARAKYAVTPKLDMILGYVNFQPGRFTETVGRPDSSNFVYLEVTVRFI